MSLYEINSSSLWLYNIYIPLSMAIFSWQKSMLITPVILCYQWPVIIHWPCESKQFLLVPMWFPSWKLLNLHFPKLANAHLKLQLATMKLQQRSLKSTKYRNRLCGHSSGIRGMCEVSHSNRSMTLMISEVADRPRHPSTRMLSKAGFWGGRIPAGNSLSSTEIGLCSELHVLVFKSQIAYGDRKFLF